MPLTCTYANALKATYPCWPIASRFLTLMPFNAMESLVSTLPHIPPCFILEPFLADDACCRCFAGDIQEFENAPRMTTINLSATKCTGKDAFYAYFFVDHLNTTNILEPFFADDTCCRCFAGDIQVFENTPEMTYIHLDDTKCTGTYAFCTYYFLDHLMFACVTSSKKYR